MGRILTVLVLAARAALAADISGTWNVTVQIQGNTGNPTFVLKQEGEKLTGNYSGQLGEAPVTGSVKGDKVELSFLSKSDIAAGKITYRGIVEGAKMSGTVQFGSDLGEGTWEATRK